MKGKSLVFWLLENSGCISAYTLINTYVQIVGRIAVDHRRRIKVQIGVQIRFGQIDQAAVLRRLHQRVHQVRVVVTALLLLLCALIVAVAVVQLLTVVAGTVRAAAARIVMVLRRGGVL